MNSEDAVKALKSTVYAFNEFRLEAENLLLLRNSEVVPVPPKACEVLLALIEANGKLITKQEILDKVWAETFVEEANLTHHISALRKALGEDKNGRKFIETIPRRGYRFVAPVSQLQTGATEIVFSERTTARFVEEIEIEKPDDDTPSPIEAAAPLEAKATRQNTGRARNKFFAAAAVAAVLIICAVGFGFYKFISAAANFRAGKMIRLTSTGKTELAAVSPDGKFIAHVQGSNDGDSLRVRQIAAEGETQIVAPAKSEIRAVNFSPDGNLIYYIVGKNNFQGTLFQTPALGGQTKKIADDIYLANLGVNGVGFSSDGKQIAFVRLSPSPKNNESFVVIADADGANEKVLIKYQRPELLYGTPAFAPEGKTLAVPFQNSSGMNVLHIALADASAATILPVDLNAVLQIVWLPDGKNLLMVAENDAETVLYQIYQVAFPGGALRRVNADFNNYDALSLTADGRGLVAVRTVQTANLWTVPDNTAPSLKQLTSGFETYDGVTGLGWLPDGKIFYEAMPGGKQGIFSIDAGGATPKMLAAGGGFGAASPDGRFLVYQKSGIKDGRMDQGIFLFDTAAGNERRLTVGWDVFASFTPDGRHVVFTRWGEDAELATLRRVSVEGGEPLHLTKFQTIIAEVSPDGKNIAVARWRGAKKQIVVIPFGGDEPTQIFDADFAMQDRFGKRAVAWTADGRAVNYIRETDGIANLWRQPLDGGAPVQITNFTTDSIFNFAFSPRGEQLVMSRGTVNSDVVLIENAE